MTKYFLQILLFIFISNYTNAQINNGKLNSSSSLIHYTTNDGLPQIQITSLFKATNGIIYVGTKYGAAYFDGTKFIPIKKQNDFSTNKYVQSINNYDDNNAIICYKGKSIQIVNPFESTLFPIDCNNYINKEDEILGTTKNNGKNYINLFYLHTTTKFDTIKLLKYECSNKKISPIKKFVCNNFYNISDSLLLFLKFDTINGIEICQENIYDTYKEKVVITDTILCSKINYRNIVNNSLLIFKLDSNYVKKSTQQGIAKLDFYKRIFQENILSTNVKKYSEKYNTYFGGQFFYKDSSHLLLKFKNEQDELISNEIPTISKVLDDNGTLWVGTEVGIYFINPFCKNYTLGAVKSNYDEIWGLTFDSNYVYFNSRINGTFISKLSSNHWSLLNNSKNEIGATIGGLGCLTSFSGMVYMPHNPGMEIYKNGKFVDRIKFPKPFTDINKLVENVKTNTIYINSYDYLHQYNEQTKKIGFLNSAEELGLKYILDIEIDTLGNLYLLGNGIVYYNTKTKKFKKIYEKSVGFGEVDSKNNFWFVDCYNNINLYNSTVNKIQKINTESISNSLILDAKLYNNKLLFWGGTNEIFFTNIEDFYKTGKFNISLFATTHELNVLEGGQNSFSINYKDSSMWWACSDKVIQFYPNKIISKAASHFSSFLFIPKEFRNENEESIIAYKNENEIILPHNYRDIQFNVVANNTYNYYYEIDGLSTLAQSKKFLLKLNMGSHKVYFYYLNEKQEKVYFAKFNLYIPLNFLEKLIRILWILLSIILLLFILFYFYYSRRKNNIELKLIKTNIELELNKFDTHFIKNSLRLISKHFSFISDKKIKENAEDDLENLENLYNKYFEIITSKIPYTIQTEINFLHDYIGIQQRRYPERFRFELKIEDNSLLSNRIASKITQLFLENAIEKAFGGGEKGILELRYKQLEDNIIIEIYDNGVGYNNTVKTKEKEIHSMDIVKNIVAMKLQTDSKIFKLGNNKFYNWLDHLFNKSNIIVQNTDFKYLPFYFNIKLADENNATQPGTIVTLKYKNNETKN